MEAGKTKRGHSGKLSDFTGNFAETSGTRLTSCRRNILNAIYNYEGHFRAEDLVERIRRLGRSVSLVTVYRNLPLLERAGVIRRTCVTENVAWYERAWKAEHHDHLICTECGKVVEFEYPAIDVLQEAVAGEHGFLLTDHHLELMGVCRQCQAAETEEKRPEPENAGGRQQ
jgi:Fur family ferric uptake transcriptional regulator